MDSCLDLTVRLILVFCSLTLVSWIIANQTSTQIFVLLSVVQDTVIQACIFCTSSPNRQITFFATALCSLGAYYHLEECLWKYITSSWSFCLTIRFLLYISTVLMLTSILSDPSYNLDAIAPLNHQANSKTPCILLRVYHRPENDATSYAATQVRHITNITNIFF
jgi:CDP-diglyceride synthetase